MKIKNEPRLTSLAHGGGCGCKVSPEILTDILGKVSCAASPEELLVGLGTSDDAAVYQINESQAIVSTTDFFNITAKNTISDPIVSINVDKIAVINFCFFNYF